MMKTLRFISILFLAASIFCTDLQEELRSDLPADQAREFLKANVDFNSLLETVYRDFDSRYIQHAGSVWLLQEVSADGAIVPSRPSGWDNGGVYRELHTHSWVAENPYIQSLWTGLNKGIFDATNVMSFEPDPETEAEARFLRAYFMYSLLDLYDRVPFREPGDDLLQPAMVLTGKEAADFIIGEVEAALPHLSTAAPAYKASQNAARGLLARMYLNRGVYENRENPQISAEDLDQVIRYADEIVGKSL